MGAGCGVERLLELSAADRCVPLVVGGEHAAVQDRFVDHRRQLQRCAVRAGVEHVLASAAGLHTTVDLGLGQGLPGGQDDLPVVVRGLQ